MTRRIAYISGTRADFGLMRRTLQAICAAPELSLGVIVTGMHLSDEHGRTIREVEASGIPILTEVPVPLSPACGATMAKGIAIMIAGFTEWFARERPDMVLLLGDRGEMLAGAIAALHLGIAVAHIHGGERSGTIDEPVRHAISKLSHIHLVATEGSRQRLIRMGENPVNVHVVGAPGLEGLATISRASPADVVARYGLVPERPLALVLYHPVVQEAAEAGEQAAALLDQVLAAGLQALVLMPNADAGSDAVRARLESFRDREGVALVTHLEREAFLDAMAIADVMIGNSSAGIIEAASFGTRVVNVGSRQNLRERNANVLDCPADPTSIRSTLQQALARQRTSPANIYGDGRAGERILSILRDTPLDARVMTKINEY